MPSQPLDYHAVPGPERRNRFALRVTLVFIGVYCLAVVVMALAKITMNPRVLQWNEVYQGPAYTLGGCALLFAAAVRLRGHYPVTPGSWSAWIRRYKCWLIPGGVAALGIALFVGGFAWAIISGVAVPDQDPTPAMQAHARLHTRISQGIILTGLAALVLAIASLPIFAVVWWVGRRRAA
jgi:hypothetical protein